MFSRISTMFLFTALGLSAVVTGLPGPGNTPPTTTVTVTAPPVTSTVPASTCTTGPIQCCNSVQSSSDPSTSALLGLLGIIIQGVTAEVGVTCDPITVIGGGSAGCSAQTVCCANNSFNGVVAIGCTPVNLAL